MFPTYQDLRGRSALVTGASSGIGRGVALAVVEQGVRVVAQHRTHETPPGCSGVRADLGTEEGCIAVAQAAGSVDLLVHSAGIYNAGPIDRISSDALEEMFRVNTFSAF